MSSSREFQRGSNKAQVSRNEVEGIKTRVGVVESALVSLTTSVTEAVTVSQECKRILDRQEDRERTRQELEAERKAEEQIISDRVRERTSMLEIQDARIDGAHRKRMTLITILVGVFTTIFGAIASAIGSHLIRK